MLEVIKKLVAPYKYKVEQYRPHGIFVPVVAQKIKIEEVITAELFQNIFNALQSEFGEPLEVDDYYGFIFKGGEKFIMYNVIEEYYGYDVMNIIIFKKCPKGKKIEYSEYCQVVNAVKSFSEEAGLKYSGVNSYVNGGFSFIMSDDKVYLMLTISEKELAYYISTLKPEEIGIRVIPHHNGKLKVKLFDNESLCSGLDKIKEELKAIG